MATIVVLEDDDVIRSLVTRVLRMHGHSVLSFEDAAPALEKVDFATVDLVVTDLTMPTTGESAIRVLRARGLALPILVMTGYADSEKTEYLIALGAQKVLHKPFTLGDFLDTVTQLLPG